MKPYRGKFIVLDGMDGAGKKTQMDLLVSRLEREGHSLSTADFPQYGKPSCWYVEQYLNGKFGTLEEIGARKASFFYALDRFADCNRMKGDLGEGKIMVSNRYVSANKGHQLGKIHDEKEMHEFLGWLNNLEYETLGLPVPDLTLFLHMAPEIGQRLVDQKNAREYVGGKKRDIHEADISHLTNAERAYLFCVEHDQTERWQTITCFEGDEPLRRYEIHEQVYRLVRDIL